MKNLTSILILALAIGFSSLTSCNKKLKKEIEELDNSVSQLKSENSSLQEQLTTTQNLANQTSQILGSNEPITATTTYVDDNNVTKTYTDTYYFKAGNYDTQYMEENGDGTYDVYIERFGDVNWNEGAWVFFTYNPTSGAITNKSCGQYWDWNLPYNDYVYLSEGYTGVSISITINSINMNTGDISISVSGNGDSTFTSTTSYYTVNDIGTVNTSFNFTGKLKVFSLN